MCSFVGVKPAGQPFGETDDLLRNIKVDPTPRLTPEAAAARAHSDTGCLTDCAHTADLWIVRKDGADHLAYRIELRKTGGGPASLPIVFVDGHNGTVILRYDNFQTGK